MDPNVRPGVQSPAPMGYTVFARKYRPQTFADLVGQEHVTRTLTNAITSDRVAHAFLFTGVRGVGKTTTARIVAKALNCERGPSGEPCNVCDPCREITSGVDMDVLEIDGASNNSVDDVRRLQETLPFRPARDRYKVIIVDEVHMLSTGAFNAFLKTLEEPPSHVKFLFATTEIHKVPITIRSRCQRYDFRLIPQTVVAAYLRTVLAKENISTDDASVAVIARESAGSMRDALTLLDQVVAFSGNTLSGELVAQALGIAQRDQLFVTLGAIVERNPAEVIRAVDAVATQGLDFLHFGKSLLALARDLVVLQVTGPETDLVDLVDEERARGVELGKKTQGAELERLFASLTKLVDEVGRSPIARTALEMGLVRLATRPSMVALGELMGRIESLERALAAGGGIPSGRPGGAPTGGTGGTGGPSSGSGARASTPAVERDVRMRTASVVAPRIATVPTVAPAVAPVVAAPAIVSAEVAVAADDTVEASISATSTPAPAVTESISGQVLAAAERRIAATAPKVFDESHDVLARWQPIVAVLRETKPALAAVLDHGIPQEISPTRIAIVFPEGSFFGLQAQSPDGALAIAAAAAPIFGQTPRIEIIFADKSKAVGRTVAQIETERRKERSDEQRQQAMQHPAVLEALAVFPESAASAEVLTDQERQER